jgi:hypothetical protein
MKTLWVVIFGSIFAAVAGAQAPQKAVEIGVRPIDGVEAGKVSWVKDVQPLLNEKCSECHSSDERKNEFEISSVETLRTRGRKDGPGVLPGRPDESAIILRIRGLTKPQMPKGRPALSEDEVHLLRMWIAAGAKDDSGGAAAAAVSVAAATTRPAYEVVSDPLAKEILDPERFEKNEDKLGLLIKWREDRIGKLKAMPEVPKVMGATKNAIDHFVLAKWEGVKTTGETPVPRVCDDSTFVRRVYLDVVGLIPTVEQTQKFLADQSADKREKLVDELLARNADYAANWTPFWEDALGSGVVTGGLRARGNYQEWIRKSFEENKPYDLLVLELINPRMSAYAKTAEAQGKPKGPKDYILTKNHGETLVSVSNASQVFLGTSMKCASCHNHFLNTEWPQSRFLALAGLFAERDMESIRCEKPSGKFVPAAFPFSLPELPVTTSKARLQLLAVSLIDPTNPRFSATIVNRLWKRYFGLGLFEPVDDYRMDTPASHPELLEWLAQDLVRHGCDLKHTIRLILTSRTYQMRYEPGLEDHFEVAKPTEPRYFRSPGLRRLTAEQFMDGVRIAVDQTLSPSKRLFRSNNSTALSRALGRPAARAEISTGRPDDVAVVQELELLNGKEIHSIVYAGKTIEKLVGDEKRVEKIYLATLSRMPSDQEKKVAEEYVRVNGASKEVAGDLFWALICSPEFQYVK